MLFELEDGKKVKSMIYWDQILKSSLQLFWNESFEDIQEPIFIEDNSFLQQKTCISIKQEFKMTCYQHPQIL